MRDVRKSGAKAAVLAFLTTAVFAGFGCDERAKAPTSRPSNRDGGGPARTQPAGGDPGTGAAADPRAKPGYVVGRVLDETGQPIAVKDARVQVSVIGISDETNRKAEYHVLAGPDGNYEVKVDPGNYRTITGRIEFG